MPREAEAVSENLTPESVVLKGVLRGELGGEMLISVFGRELSRRRRISASGGIYKSRFQNT